MPRPIKLLRKAQEIKVKGQFKGEPDEVKTRMTKREFEKRRELFNEEHLWSDYLDFVESGGNNDGAGRPKRYDNPAIRQKAYRLRKKLSQGQSLNTKELAWLKDQDIKLR